MKTGLQNIKKYLKRINFRDKLAIDEESLIHLHEHHVFHVPFENLDIHYRRRFDLEPENVYRKIVVHSRGGFCYELNSLFNALLCEIGFKSRIVSAKVIDNSGNLGPEYDHMSVLVDLNNTTYLADVGFGDLFTRPLAIKSGIQSDGRNLFRIENFNDHDFVLSMSSDHVTFHKKYMFNLDETAVQTSRLFV